MNWRLEKKRCRRVEHKTAETRRYNERLTIERVNARLNLKTVVEQIPANKNQH